MQKTYINRTTLLHRDRCYCCLSYIKDRQTEEETLPLNCLIEVTIKHLLYEKYSKSKESEEYM